MHAHTFAHTCAHTHACMQVAGSPELYPVLVDGGCVPTLLALLSHENSDIAADVLDLLAQLTGAGERCMGLHVLEEGRALRGPCIERRSFNQA